MHKKIETVIKWIDTPALKTIIRSIMNKHHDVFIEAPGGCSRHHAYKGGLLDHSFMTASTGKKLAEQYVKMYSPPVHVDLVVAGAFLHDVGKVSCYVHNGEKQRYESTIKSKLHHHIPIGFHIVATEVDKLLTLKKIDEALADNLLHIIVSHHGRVEYRSNRSPKTQEAFLVSQADLIDAYMGSPEWARNSYNKERK